jgi:hypothetical protein
VKATLYSDVVSAFPLSFISALSLI